MRTLYIAPRDWHLKGVDFDIVGDGPMTESLKATAPPNVYFHPSVSKPIAVALMRSAAVVLCPSRHESFGLVAAEARALGRHVVATDVGAQAQNATHILSQQASAEDFALLIQDAIANRRISFEPSAVSSCADRQAHFANRMSELSDVPTLSEVCA